MCVLVIAVRIGVRVKRQIKLASAQSAPSLKQQNSDIEDDKATTFLLLILSNISPLYFILAKL